MEYVTLITALLPLIANLEPLFVQIIGQLKSQGAMTDDQILAHAAQTLNDDQVAIVAERLRLQGEINAQPK